MDLQDAWPGRCRGAVSLSFGDGNHPYNIDLHCLSSPSAQAMEPAELIGLVELAARRRAL
jgi:hypothetical protein